MDGSILKALPGRRPPYVIVVGNEKGGTGKSTTAMHLAVSLLRLGYAVGSIDLDARQSTLSRYLANRAAHAQDSGLALPMPAHRCIERSAADSRAASEAEDRRNLRQACGELAHCDFIVIDTPGSDVFLSRLAHETADTLVTPLNDSFLDIDVLAQIDRRRRVVLGPSHYSQMVWEQSNRRTVSGRAPIDWVVMRNRLTHIEARNKREIGALLSQLASRIGFRLAPGFGERVVFRELFLNGLTLLDLPAMAEDDADAPASSHVAARQEIRSLLESIGLTVIQPAQS
ncbi:MAG TPA: division plane positioning ATPase MipZ [Kiloniellales bacterium]